MFKAPSEIQRAPIPAETRESEPRHEEARTAAGASSLPVATRSAAPGRSEAPTRAASPTARGQPLPGCGVTPTSTM